MEEAKFTWFPKLTATAARVPESQRGALLWALAVYGTTGQEPDLEWPLDALFESLREDIDNSKRAISAGKTGGRGKRKEPSSDSEDPFQESETPLYGDANPPLYDDEKVYTGVSEPVNGGSGKAEPKPYQTIPIHTKPKKERARFTPPTVEDVRALCAKRGYTFDPEAFVAFYESKGWMVGRNPMKSWPAACATWQKREAPAKGDDIDDEYSRL